MTNSRAAAIEVLLAWERSQDSLDQVLEGVCSKAFAEPRDRQFVMALVYGVFRWRGYLDGIIAGFSAHPITKMKPLTLAALRIGLFQLLFMDRVPEAAAINETVKALVQARQPKWLTGFVNGLLRNAVRRKAALPPADAAAAVMSHPDWLVSRWQRLYGRTRTEKICAANNRVPQLALRVNTARISVARYLELLGSRDLAAVCGSYGLEAVLLSDYHGGVAELPGYGDGFFQVQDEAAQLVCLLLAPFEAGAYLDACAGLGGKTLHLAQLLPEGSRLVAIEPSAKRIALLKENLQRFARQEVAIHQGTLEDYAEKHEGRFKGVLVDAPCSGLGVVGRQPDIRWQRSYDVLKRNQAKQQALLSLAAGQVAEGGVLVYATCSIDPIENDEVIDRFLQDHSDFSLTSAREHLPPAAHCLVDGKGFFRTTPEQGLDGFFAARMKRKE